MKYQFVAEHQQEYPITLMCQVLEVSVSGYYAWCKRPVSAHQREDARLAAAIQTIFLENRQVYGSPRIHAALQARGMRCGRKRVVRLMQALGLQAKRHRQHKPSTTSSDPTARFAPNLLNRDGRGRPVPTPSGSRISPQSPQQMAGCTWPWSWTCSHAWLLVGRWPQARMSNW